MPLEDVFFLDQIQLFGNPRSNKTVSRSSAEAEYRSLATIYTDIMWLRLLLSELHIKTTHTPVIHCDNLSTVLLAANQVLHYCRTKHMEIDFYFVRDQIIAKKVHDHLIPAAEQIADTLTKAVSNPLFLSLGPNLCGKHSTLCSAAFQLHSLL